MRQLRYYYIDATANSGKHQVRPMPAPAGYWQFKVTQPTGFDELTSASIFSKPAFPNPSKGITCIPVNMAANVQGKLVLRNALGQLVHVLHEGSFSGERNYFLNSESLPAGAYVIELQTANRAYHQKLMVQ